METITLELTLDETNLVLACLGEQKYIKVASLVQKIQAQGAAQLQNATANGLATHQDEPVGITALQNGQ